MKERRSRTSFRKVVTVAVSLFVFMFVVAVETSSRVTVSVDAVTPHSIPSLILRARVPTSSVGTQGNDDKRKTTSSSSSSLSSLPSLWMYRGALYDPLDGRQIASVQGLELVRVVDDTTGLAIDSILKKDNATFDECTTFWSQKIFCYTTKDDDERDL